MGVHRMISMCTHSRHMRMVPTIFHVLRCTTYMPNVMPMGLEHVHLHLASGSKGTVVHLCRGVESMRQRQWRLLKWSSQIAVQTVTDCQRVAFGLLMEVAAGDLEQGVQ